MIGERKGEHWFRCVFFSTSLSPSPSLPLPFKLTEQTEQAEGKKSVDKYVIEEELLEEAHVLDLSPKDEIDVRKSSVIVESLRAKLDAGNCAEKNDPA